MKTTPDEGTQVLGECSRVNILCIITAAEANQQSVPYDFYETIGEMKKCEKKLIIFV